MAAIPTVDVKIEQARFCVIFFPVATYTKVGYISELTVFGISVYQRVNDARWCLGVKWGK